MVCWEGGRDVLGGRAWCVGREGMRGVIIVLIILSLSDSLSILLTPILGIAWYQSVVFLVAILAQIFVDALLTLVARPPWGALAPIRTVTLVDAHLRGAPRGEMMAPGGEMVVGQIRRIHQDNVEEDVTHTGKK